MSEHALLQRLVDLEKSMQSLPSEAQKHLSPAYEALRAGLMQQASGTLHQGYDAPSHQVDYERMIEGVRDFAVFLTDVDGRISHWNRGSERHFGYTALEAIGQEAAIIYTPEDREAGVPQHELEQARTEGQALNERWHVRKNTSRFWASGFVTPMRDADGRLIGFSKILRDDTARKQLQDEREHLVRELQVQQNWLETTIEQAPSGIIIVEAPSGRIIHYNYAAVHILGHEVLPVENTGDYSNYGAIHADGRPYAPEEYPAARALQGEVVEQETTLYRRGDQSVTYLSINAAPVRTADNAIVAAVCTLHDISEQRHLEEQRARLYIAEQLARQAAEGAVRVRDAFLAIAAHELRTPLTSLVGYTQVLQRRLSREVSLTERDQRALELVVSQARRLHMLVSSLFDVSRLNVGRAQIEQQPLDLRELVQRVAQELEVTLEQHTLSVVCSVEPIPITGDQLRLEQVTQNLVQNAIKYSPSGGHITILATVEPGTAVLSISDEGIGIPDAAQEHLFEQFYRAANAEGTSVSGLGVGLYVSHEIITLHGGTISVTSTEGQGSTFVVRLPLRSAENKAIQ